MEDPAVQEKVGYTGEGISLEAEALGLGTCWVGGFFRPTVAAQLTGTAGNERVLCVTPVGYARRDTSLEDRVMAGFGSHHKRKPLTSLVSGQEMKDWPEWVRPALEAARLAPSAVNRQPWHFYVQPDSVTISINGPGSDLAVSRRLDCGIAKLGLPGRWEFLPHPRVAKFSLTPG
jgi:nitroreductase